MFKQYLLINNRNFINLMNIYKNSKYKVYKWYRYINTRKVK